MNHDFLCPKCGGWTEVSFTLAELEKGPPRQIECSCGGVARHTWRTAPGLAGVTEPGTRGIRKTFEPGTYDVQAGRSFASLKERDDYLKRRGLVALGPEEFKRTIDSTNEPQPDFSTLPAAMKDAWEEVEAGKASGLPLAKLDENVPVQILKE